MSTSNLGRTLAIATAIGAVGTAAYAVYFDYQRRSNPNFRKELKKRVKKQVKAEKHAEEEAKREKLQKVTEYLTKELAADPIPSSATERESVFTANVELGERLSMTPGKELEAAAKFYKALTVYPNPADLLGIYQRSVPENIYEYIVLMIAIMPPANVSTFIRGAAASAESSAAEKEVNEAVSGVDE